MEKTATLFGGGFKDTSTKEYKDTVEIGRMLSEKGYVVKSGGYSGLMEAVSKGATENGGTAIGYTCETFRSTKGNEFLSSTVVSADLYDRLRHLIENTDVYIFQKGGIGTLSEFFTVWDEMRKKKEHPKMILVGSHWRDIILSVSGLITVAESCKLTFVDSLEHLEKEL